VEKKSEMEKKVEGKKWGREESVGVMVSYSKDVWSGIMI